MFYPDGRSLGQRTIPVESQSKDAQFAKYRENLRWSIGGVTFATLHIVGSNDNFGRTPEMDAEQSERKAANIAWMRAAFAAAKARQPRGRADGAGQPRLRELLAARCKEPLLQSVRCRVDSPCRPIQRHSTITSQRWRGAGNYDKPVAYLHGDTHLFRIDKPLYSKKTNRAFENFTRVETFGDPDTHWVRVTVDPGDAQVFRFDAQIIPDNVVNRRTR